ncbi:MAG: alkaline phosphatase family protein [Acidobacteriia bacterium]|nr:alkaline phosphatase family protein [Terriglobia bacterium]
MLQKVMLIGWDAADWKVINPLMDAGKMPNVQRLVENGSMAQIATLHPPLSPMLWTSIATGKRPFQHGIHGFAEPTPDGQGVQPVTNLSRKCKALWNILNQNGLRSIVVGWWPSHPAEPINGVTVSDHYHQARGPLENGWPMLPGTVHPPELAETLAELRFHPQEVIGEMIDQFVPKAREVDQDKDRRLVGLTRTLCECVSIHSAATWLLDNQPWDFCGIYYDAIDHFCHGFMQYHAPRQAHISERDFELYQNVVNAAYLFHDQLLGALLQRAGPDTRVILMSDHGFHPDHLRPRSIPRIPAGPAIEHRDFGIFVAAGPGIKKDELLHGASVLDITPTVLTMFGLAVGADMAGKVLRGAFEVTPDVESVPSWEDMPPLEGHTDGRHPPHTRLDAVAAHESMEQMVALGYIERPDENREKAVADTVAELQYNLGESYQDDDRHADAIEIFRELYRADPDEQRYAVHLFVSCQALTLVDEMSAIVDDLDGRRRLVYEEGVKRAAELRALARERFKDRRVKSLPAPPEESADAESAAVEAELPHVGDPPAAPHQLEPLLTEAERAEWKAVRNAVNFEPPVVDYLKAQVFTARRYWGKALECLERVQDAHLLRPGLFLQTADLYVRMLQWEDAGKTYARALTVDPDNPHAHIGMARVALHRRDYAAAAQSALDGLERLFHYPLGHFLLGVAAAGMKNYERAADAFRAAIGLNPNYPQAHLRLAWVLKRRLNDPAGAERHFALFRELRSKNAGLRHTASVEARHSPKPSVPTPAGRSLPPLADEVVIVSGLPRSGTSMIMQMLAAGGIPPLTDGLREADEDNPRGYFEYEPVKRMMQDAKWLEGAKGKAVKIVAPLLPGLPAGLVCRVIFIERNLDEILASQGQMLIRRGEKVDDTPARRARLKDQYARRVAGMKLALENRPATNLLCLDRSAVLDDSAAAAAAINAFLGGACDPARMAAEVDPSLDRHRT